MSNNSHITVTVLMPAYNAEKYIADAIQSVLDQTFTDFELLIVNDGSTDGTVRLIHSFNDERIVLINQDHGGVSDALNNGLALAKGKYIARFDADDICLPERLEKQLEFLVTHPDYVLTGSDAAYMMETGEHLFYFSCIGHTHREIMQQLYFYCPFIHSSVMYVKDAVIQSGGYSPHAHNFEDYLLWTQLVKFGRLHNMTDTLIRIRFNPDSVTIDEKWRGKRFRAIKRRAIKRGAVTAGEGEELLSIIRKQNIRTVKEGAYYALCGKKFLTDHYQPSRARSYLLKAIAVHPFRQDNYALLAISFFPEKIIQWLHRKSPNRL